MRAKLLRIAAILCLPLSASGCAEIAKDMVENPAMVAALHDGRGAMYIQKQQYLLARREYDAALEALPDDPTAFQGRGYTYFATRQYDAAIRDYTAGLGVADQDSDPKATRARLLDFRAAAYDAKKDKRSADRDYAAAIASDPASANPYLSRANAYAGRHDDSKAIADYSDAIRLEPHRADIYFQRGLVYANGGNQNAAIADYTEALRLSPGDEITLNNRCFSRAIQGSDMNAALADCNASLRSSGRGTRFYPLSSRAFVYLKLHDYRDALADANAALAIYPHDSDSLYLRGEAELKLGEVSQGNEDVSAALAINTGKAAEYRRYGLR